MKLDALVRDLATDASAEQFRHRNQVSGVFAGDPLSNTGIHEFLRSGDLGIQLDHLELCVLHLGERFAEEHTFFGPTPGSFPEKPGTGHRTDTGDEALVLELHHLLLETAADVADRVRDGHTNVFEIELARVRTPIADLVEQLGPDLMLIVVTPKLDRNGQSSKWVKSLESAGVNLTIWPVGPRELPGWIAARMRQSGLQPDRDAIAMIADRVEGNLLAAGQEIEKLRLLHGEGAVTAEDVATAVANSSRFDVFKLVDAALAGDAKRAAKLLDSN